MVTVRRPLALGALLTLAGCTGWTLPRPPADAGSDARDGASHDATDGALDAPTDAQPDVQSDAQPDVVLDAPVDAPIDAPSDVLTDVQPDVPTDLDPPQPRAPMSTSLVTTQQPVLSWIVPAGTVATDVTVCADRACTTVEQRFRAASDHASVPMALTRGVHFWSVQSACGPSPCRRSSPVWQFTVPAVSAMRANAFSTVLDTNGDGRADLLVGAPETIGAPHMSMAGQAYLYLGPLMAAPIPLYVTGTLNFGGAVASAGDVDGDGYGDIAIGTTSNNGHVYVYPGAAGGIGTVPYDLSGASNGFGSTVAGVGDVNGDGFGDVIVGTPGAAGGAGAVQVFHGGFAGPGPVAFATLAAPAGEMQFGYAVATAGDLNADGYADVMVTGRANGGTVYVYRGSSSGLIATPAAILHPSNSPGNFGDALGGAGDTNGDGYADIVIGAPANSGVPQRVWVYYGLAPGPVNTTSPTVLNDLFGNPSDRYGAALWLGPDANGDGLADLALGVPGQPVDTGMQGYAYAMLTVVGARGYDPHRLDATADTRRLDFGSAVSLADYDGDGLADFAASDPVPFAGGSRVLVYLSSDGVNAPAGRVLSTPVGTDDFGRVIR